MEEYTYVLTLYSPIENTKTFSSRDIEILKDEYERLKTNKTMNGYALAKNSKQ